MTKIEKIMEEKNITLDVLAAALNISDTKLENILDMDSFEKDLDFMQIAELARVLDVEMDDLGL